jgi:glycosyltransferase involved in cell wall biosynthesis
LEKPFNEFKFVTMKIIQSCGSFSWGGLEMSVLQTAEMLKTRGHETTLLCAAASTLEKKANETGVSTVSIFAKSSSIKRFKSLLNSDNYDVIHTHLSHDLWIIVPALKLSGTSSTVKLVLTKHMASGVSKKDILHRFLYKRINKIIAVSEFIKRNVLKTCPVNESKITIIPDAISTDIFDSNKFNKSSTRHEFNIDDSCFMVGIIGRMTPGKGHEDFLNAAKRIKDNSNQRIKFLITGKASYGEEKYEAELKNLSMKLGLTDDVIFAGFRDDIPRVLSAVDVLAFPSHEESFGITLIEAMAMKVPIVASNNAGVVDIVINGETGILIPAKDPVSLANAIAGLIENPELRKKLGETGRKRVEKNFNIDKTIKELEKVYEE